MIIILRKIGKCTLLLIFFSVTKFSVAQMTNPQADSAVTTKTIELELNMLKKEVSKIKSQQQNAGNELSHSARLQFSSIKTAIFGSIFGGVMLVTTGNMALSGGIFSATLLVSFGQHLVSIAKIKEAGEILKSSESPLTEENILPVSRGEVTNNADPFAFEYALEYLFYSDGKYVYSHNSLQREIEEGVNGPFVYEEVSFLLKNHPDFRHASIPTIAQLQQLLNSDTKLLKRLYKNEMVVWSRDFGSNGYIQCLNFRTGKIEEHSVEDQQYFVPIVSLDKLIN